MSGDLGDQKMTQIELGSFKRLKEGTNKKNAECRQNNWKITFQFFPHQFQYKKREPATNWFTQTVSTKKSQLKRLITAENSIQSCACCTRARAHLFRGFVCPPRFFAGISYRLQSFGRFCLQFWTDINLFDWGWMLSRMRWNRNACVNLNFAFRNL